MLRRCPWTVPELAEELDMTIEGVAYHLRGLHSVKKDRVKRTDIAGRAYWTTAYSMEAV
jgi:hypothetical protein